MDVIFATTIFGVPMRLQAVKAVKAVPVRFPVMPAFAVMSPEAVIADTLIEGIPMRLLAFTAFTAFVVVPVTSPVTVILDARILDKVRLLKVGDIY